MKLRSVWMPRLAECNGAPFERLAAALTEDIASGVISADDRLPAHRDLAWRLKIGVGTVTKAYASLERRGLVRSVRGRGMFVKGATLSMADTIDLGVNTPPQVFTDRLLSATLTRLAKRLDAGSFSAYAEPGGRLEHRRLAARWLEGRGLDVPPQRLVLTNGAQHALSIAFAVACPPGTTLLTEAATFPGALLVARQMGLSPVPLAMDEGGLRPDAVASVLATRQGTARVAIYVTPTLQNPTSASMGAARRRDLVDLARGHDVLIIEDDVYGLFGDTEHLPLGCLAPERTFHVSGLSKTLSPGLRIGMLAVPDKFIAETETRLLASSTTASPLSAGIMELWLTDGTAEAVAASIRDEAVRRCALARSLLPATVEVRSGGGFHIWLPMATKEAERIVDRAAAAGVILLSARAPLTDPDALHGGVRLSLGGPPLEKLTLALTKMSNLLVQVPRPVI